MFMRSHGFKSTYRAGCRCDLCRQANTDAQRAYYRRVGGNKNRSPEVNRARRELMGSSRGRWPESQRAADERRRARKAGVEAEKFNASEVFDRDEWVCGICNETVDRGLAYPDPKSPSLDHVVPLSFGGPHTRANTRLAHLTCNIRRGNRVDLGLQASH